MRAVQLTQSPGGGPSMKSADEPTTSVASSPPSSMISMSKWMPGDEQGSETHAPLTPPVSGEFISSSAVFYYWTS